MLQRSSLPKFWIYVILCPNSCPYPHLSIPISKKQHWKLKFHALKPSVIVILPKKLSTKSSNMTVRKRSAYWNIWDVPFLGPTCSFSGIYIGEQVCHWQTGPRPTSPRQTAPVLRFVNPWNQCLSCHEGSRQVTLLETNSEFIPENSMVGRCMAYFQGWFFLVSGRVLRNYSSNGVF